MVFYGLQSVLPQFWAAWQLVGFIKITFNTKSTLVTWQSRRPNWCLAGPRWKHIYAYLSVLGQCIRIEHYSLQSKTRRHFITQSNLLNFLHFASEQKNTLSGTASPGIALMPMQEWSLPRPSPAKQGYDIRTWHLGFNIWDTYRHICILYDWIISIYKTIQNI